MLAKSCLTILLCAVCFTSAAVNRAAENSSSDEVRRQQEHIRRADIGDPEEPREAKTTKRGTIQIPDTCAKILTHRIRSVARKVVAKLETSDNRSPKLEEFIARAKLWIPELDSDDGGALYVRWGRNTCPNTDTEQVYSGIAGGGYYGHDGSGSDLLCLTRHPEYHNYTDTFEGHASLYGAEYEATRNYFSHRNAPVNNVNGLQDHDVPCAVCRANTRRTQIMIAGRKTCHGEGWTREYWGYLATGNYAHKNQINYVCVDEAPEADPKGAPNSNGALLYVVQGVCGSLPCPPYVNNWELVCVVCTK